MIFSPPGLVRGSFFRYHGEEVLSACLFPVSTLFYLMPSFVHLHVHSAYSLLEALPKIGDIIKRAKSFNMSAVALTDTNAVYGLVEFYQTATKAGLRPILGTELSVRSPFSSRTSRLVLLAKSATGYRNLLKLVSRAHIDHPAEPSVDLTVLEKHADGLICLIGGPGSELADLAAQQNIAAAEKYTQAYAKIFSSENTYLEIIRDRMKDERLSEAVNRFFLAMSQRLGIPLVATNDVHYLEASDSEAQDILSCIKEKKLFQDENRSSLRGQDFSFRAAEDMSRDFAAYPGAVENTIRIAEQCKIEIALKQIQLPHYELPSGVTAQQKLRELCEEGLRRRYENSTPDIRSRLEYELSVIENTGFASYFLIVQDFINWSKNNGIVVGPGRGSAAGSLVAYLTFITDVDPIRYQLIFERFLNPERISMPDIDTDFDDERRDHVLRYVEEKYGKDHVAQIITFGTMAARASLRDVGRVLGYSYSYCDRIAKLVPMFTTLSEALEQVPELQHLRGSDPDCDRLITTAQKIEGVARHTSIHACGVVITKNPLTDYTAIQLAGHGEQSVVSQYSLHPVEDLGLLKMDFLGLKNLTIIRNTLDIIRKTAGETIDTGTLPLDDKKTYRLFQKGATTGVFQLESSGMKRYLKDLKPTEFEDIVAMVALYRPGPMDFIPQYIERKHGKVNVEYIHPSLESVLQKTYGIVVYQEQIMEIARNLAGFSYGEADVLRKAVGKKIKELMIEQEEKLIRGMVKNGIPKTTAQKIWEFILPFARYGFNRSHAVCYAMIAYQTAYLKARYPAQFLAALMTSDGDNTDRIAIEVKECRDMGIEILPPDVNESYSTFTVVKESLSTDKPRIRFGLTAVKNLGTGVTRSIIDERKSKRGKYTSLQDFLQRLPTKDLNKKSLESLIKSGALDVFGKRELLFHNIENLLAYVKIVESQMRSPQTSLFSGDGKNFLPPLTLHMPEQPASQKQFLEWEKELLGLYISEHPLLVYKHALEGKTTPLSDLFDMRSGSPVRVLGIVTKCKRIPTKSGERMLFGLLSDASGEVEVVVFPRIYKETSFFWEEGALLTVDGKVSTKDGTPHVICDTVREIAFEDIPSLPLWNPAMKSTASVSIHLPASLKKSVVAELQAIFSKYPGSHAVRFFIEDGTNIRTLATKVRVQPNETFQTEIERVVGKKRIRVYNT